MSLKGPQSQLLDFAIFTFIKTDVSLMNLNFLLNEATLRRRTHFNECRKGKQVNSKKWFTLCVRVCVSVCVSLSLALALSLSVLFSRVRACVCVCVS